MYIASDHAGFELKNKLIDHLKTSGQSVEDCGPFEYKHEDDYPDFVYPCAVKVGHKAGSMGIVIGYSGQGEAVVANKAKGVRAAVFYGGPEEVVKLSRQHNNANVISLGAHFITAEEAMRAVDLWIETGFEGARHVKRIEKINSIELENRN
ncbi:MAG: RpiB/LacA/LacB family sugar-phosphate isomerase [Candidatus Doudnabacteria bacterium]|nr:RpiB/LacA/LacB family sugar-phosphate isomerase [Candidatus Doudnabacteria bacterium]